MVVVQSSKISPTLRVDWVDYAKGFCIIFVVMLHSTLGVEKYSAEFGLTQAGETGFMNYLVTFAQPFRMPDFFMISGLFLSLVISRSWLRYIDRKVVHFAYFYVLWLAFQFAFKSIGWIASGMSIGEISNDFLHALIHPYGTLWFIYMLPVMFIVTRLLVKVPWQITLGLAAILQILPIHTGDMIIDQFAERYVFFFAGYSLAQPIFRLAAWAKDNTSLAGFYLGAWALINGFFTFTAVPATISAKIVDLGAKAPTSLSQLPFISLLLGTAGAVAVICFCAILSKFKIASFLRYLGQNSIAVYLAFVFPMIISRELLLRFVPGLDLGTTSLIVLCVSVISPMILLEITRYTGWGKFLFERPQWAKIDKSVGSAQATNKMQPAE